METVTRPLTEAERSYLEWHLANETGPKVKEILVGSCFGAGCLTVPLLTIGLIAGAKAGALRSPRFWLGTVFLFAAVWLCFVLLGIRDRRKKAALAADVRKQIQNDLTSGLARIHRFRATAVLLAYGPKRRERNYFVRLDDSRVLFLGPWKPPTCRLTDLTYVPDEKGFPSIDFEVMTGAESRLLLEVVGKGDFLRPADEFDLAPAHANTRSAKSKLKSGEFVQVPWEEIRQKFG